MHVRLILRSGSRRSM